MIETERWKERGSNRPIRVEGGWTAGGGGRRRMDEGGFSETANIGWDIAIEFRLRGITALDVPFVVSVRRGAIALSSDLTRCRDAGWQSGRMGRVTFFSPSSFTHTRTGTTPVLDPV